MLLSLEKKQCVGSGGVAGFVGVVGVFLEKSVVLVVVLVMVLLVL